MNKFFEFKNVTDKSADIYLYEQIGRSWWDESGTTAKDFIEELAAIDKDATLNIYFNSPGGNVFDGIAIATNIKSHRGTTNAYVDALAASIASVIALSCDNVYIADHAAIMIHQASVIASGNANELAKVIDKLKSIDKQIASVYDEFAKTDDLQHWLDEMDAETWYYGQDAVDAGLANDTYKSEAIAACLSPEIIESLNFKHVPEALLKSVENVADSKSDTQDKLAPEIKDEAEEDALAEAEAEAEGEPVPDAPKARLMTFSSQNIVVKG